MVPHDLFEDAHDKRTSCRLHGFCLPAEVLATHQPRLAARYRGGSALSVAGMAVMWRTSASRWPCQRARNPLRACDYGKIQVSRAAVPLKRAGYITKGTLRKPMVRLGNWPERAGIDAADWVAQEAEAFRLSSCGTWPRGDAVYRPRLDRWMGPAR